MRGGEVASEGMVLGGGRRTSGWALELVILVAASLAVILVAASLAGIMVGGLLGASGNTSPEALELQDGIVFGAFLTSTDMRPPIFTIGDIGDVSN